MSNTTPQSPNDEPVEPEGERAQTIDERTAAERSVAEPVEAPAGESSVAEPVEAPAAEPRRTAEPPVAAPVAAAYEGGPSLRDGRGATSSGQAASSGTEHTSSGTDTRSGTEYGGTGTVPVDDPASTWAPEPTPATGPTAEYAGQTQATLPVTEHVVTPVYVSAPVAPKARGNRGAGILIALLATLVYAIVSAIVVLVIFEITKGRPGVAMRDFTQYLGTPSFYVPIIVFALAFILLVAIVNRGGWWAYVLGAFVVAVIVYFAYVGSVLLTIQAWQYTPQEVGRILSQLWANPLTLAAAIVAREVPIWFGAWIAARGRKVRERNIEARAAYDRELAAGPQPIQRAG